LLNSKRRTRSGEDALNDVAGAGGAIVTAELGTDNN
jgi:hypothetical protein